MLTILLHLLGVTAFHDGIRHSPLALITQLQHENENYCCPRTCSRRSLGAEEIGLAHSGDHQSDSFKGGYQFDETGPDGHG